MRTLEADGICSGGFKRQDGGSPLTVNLGGKKHSFEKGTLEFLSGSKASFNWFCFALF